MMNKLMVSLVESSARERAFHLLDADSGKEILGPYDRFEFPASRGSEHCPAV